MPKISSQSVHNFFEQFHNQTSHGGHESTVHDSIRHTKYYLARVLNDKLNRAVCENTHQYGEPMKDFLLANVAVIWADTPKSAVFNTNIKHLHPMHKTIKIQCLWLSMQLLDSAEPYKVINGHSLHNELQIHKHKTVVVIIIILNSISHLTRRNNLSKCTKL